MGYVIIVSGLAILALMIGIGLKVWRDSRVITPMEFLGLFSAPVRGKE